MLDGARDNRVGDAREGSRGVVLSVREGGTGGGVVREDVLLLKIAAGSMKTAELDGHAGADA